MSEITVKKILDEKLKKEFSLVVPYKNLDELINKKANEYQKTYKLAGFRPGKVPVDIIINKNFEALLADASETSIQDNINQLIDKNNYNLAIQPKVDIKNITNGFEKDKDLEFNVIFELLPEIAELDYKKISLEKLVVNLTEKDEADFLDKLVSSKKDWKEQDDSYAAKLGDSVKIDYLGKINGKAFAGGEAKDYRLELGTKTFIDTFEDQLVGKKANDECVVKVKFPKDYHSKEYAGKAAEFEVKVKKVLTAEKPEVNDEFVKKNFGFESLDLLKTHIKAQMEESYKNASEQNLKSDFFEWIKKHVKTDVPVSMVDDQFNRLWAETEAEAKRNPEKFASEKDKEKEKEKIREDAENMIKVGLVVMDIGKRNNIEVSDNEVLNEISNKVRNFPGQEEMFFNYYKNNREALNSLRGSLLEDKIVKEVLKKIDIKEKTLTVEEFQKEQEVRLKK